MSYDYENPLQIGEVSVDATDQKLLIIDVDEQIRLANYKNKWLQGLCAKSNKKRTTTNREFFIMTAEIDTGKRKVTSLTDTTLVVDDTTPMYVNELFYNANVDEVIMILSKTNSTTCTVRRDLNGAHTGDLPTWSEAETIYSLGTAYGETAQVPSGHIRLPAMESNYAQRFLYTIEITNDMIKQKSYIKPSPRAYWNKVLLEEHLLREEYLALFGKKALMTHNSSNSRDGGKIWLTNGLLESIKTNVIDLNGAELDETALEATFDQIFDHGSDEKLMICSLTVAQRLNSWGKNNVRYSPGDNKLGLNIRQLVNPAGVLDIGATKLLKEVNLSGQGIGDMIFIVDPSQVQRVVHTPTRFMPGRQNPEAGISVIKDLYEGIYGWDFGLERCHAVIRNFA